MVLGLRLLWGELSLQTAMAVLLVAPEIFVPLRRAGAEFHASTEGQAAAARVLAVLDTPVPSTTRVDAPVGAARVDAPVGAARVDAPVGAARDDSAQAPTRRPGAAALTMEGVGVDYAHRNVPALASFSLVAPTGARVALTGPSGAGKSTVFAALLRFVEPSAGTMAFGEGTSDETAVAAWRSIFAWLPQRPHLFNATMADNLRLGAPAATPSDVQRVLDAVGLAELLASLPAGLQTVLGHDGLTLSAGERQRLALARALLSPAPVLLLDEPTAALDPPTVARLAPAIEPWLEGRTVIVAAHEPVLLPRFDLVLALASAVPMPLAVSP